MSAPTSFTAARNYTESLNLTLSEPKQESMGQRYNITTDKKQAVIVFRNVEAKPCVDAKNRPFLVVTSPADDSELMTVLTSIRSRVAKELKIEESQIRSILTAGKGLMRKKLSLFLNLSNNTTLKDVDSKVVDYETVVNKTCQLGLFVHVQSVFKNNEDVYSLQLKVTQMVLMAQPTVAVEPVEMVDIGEATFEDVANLL